MKEKQTIRKIHLGDIHAFEMLFRKYYKNLCHGAYRYLQDADSSEEVVQDLFYHLWRDRAGLNIRVSVKSYLYRAISNNYKMILKKQSRRSAIEVELASESQPVQAQPPMYWKPASCLISSVTDPISYRRIFYTGLNTTCRILRSYRTRAPMQLIFTRRKVLCLHITRAGYISILKALPAAGWNSR